MKSLRFALNEVVTTISSDRIKLELSALHTSTLHSTTREIQIWNGDFNYKLFDYMVCVRPVLPEPHETLHCEILSQDCTLHDAMWIPDITLWNQLVYN